MKWKAYCTDTPAPIVVPDDSYIIIEADNLFDCINKSQDYADKYFWGFERIVER